jgi:hypothetical protein
MIRLENLTANFQGVQIEYTVIVNYEIARENICGYIFLLSRKSKSATPAEKTEIENQIADLIHYRDNLQIEDKDNIQRVLQELIPEYKKAVPV